MKGKTDAFKVEGKVIKAHSEEIKLYAKKLLEKMGLKECVKE